MGLFNSTILDVVIGLIFVYLLLSILCTAANEWAAAITKRRGKMLRKGIRQLLENQPTRSEGDPEAFLREFYKHPLITSIMHDKNHPNYIAPRTFTAVVTDLLTTSKPGTAEFADLEGGSKELPDGDVKKSILALAHRSNRDFETAQHAIEGWFNDAMDRVTGWYKRRTQIWTIAIALALTLLANADTVQISRRLWTDPVLRSAVIEEAKVRVQKPPPTISVEYEDDADPTEPTVIRTDSEGNVVSEQERQLLGQLLGWSGTLQDNNWKDWLERLLGWLLTVLALSMGAPFWFDILNKFVNVRYTGKSPDEKAKGPEKPQATVRA